MVNKMCKGIPQLFDTGKRKYSASISTSCMITKDRYAGNISQNYVFKYLLQKRFIPCDCSSLKKHTSMVRLTKKKDQPGGQTSNVEIITLPIQNHNNEIF